jgi:hypothetical protein
MFINVKPGSKKERQTHFFHGQTPHIPGDSFAWAFCSGYKDFRCSELVEAKLGVLEPRCPKCYKRNLEEKRKA